MTSTGSNLVQVKAGAVGGAKVYWFSRHPLTPQQKLVLEYLHGTDIEIWHWIQFDFGSIYDLEYRLEKYCNKGTVYLEAPADYLEELSYKFCFRKFRMTRPTIRFVCVYEYCEGTKKWLTGYDQVFGNNCINASR